jgi:predicted RNA-binding Zn-ribbon protein involved in translation (DUF1610 family)
MYDDPDAPLHEDLDDDSDDLEDAVQCYACGRWMHADAAVCPHCGEWQIHDSLAARRSRGWFWPLLIGLLVAVILVMWVGLRF